MLFKLKDIEHHFHAACLPKTYNIYGKILGYGRKPHTENISQANYDVYNYRLGHSIHNHTDDHHKHVPNLSQSWQSVHVPEG